MKSERIKDFLWGLGFVFLQIVIFRHLKIFKIQADVVFIYVLWIMFQRDRTTAIILAATMGFLQDAMMNLWGLNMFANTLIAFAGYRFIPKQSESQLMASQVFLLVLVFSLFHNIIFLGLASFVKDYAVQLYFWYILLGSSLYTAIVASIIYLFKNN